ncbi:hypothetical protein FEFB_13540 [Fructobacillus sp. EFB-N1]|uniref:hypothetical protein n=2 Tax=Fructobacillus TaxID=559173 RepID=UPI00064D9FFF|nr:hypothetical protein [Fructobacillus sp. EFB-N1]KMK52938.1 hypothetical protein FEFB_13540 [Fructobacillus sp. EFB-N1]
MAENTDNTQQTVDTSKWYFKYDPQTYAFIPGAVHEQVDNSTEVEPSGLINPVWNPSTNSWTGQSMEDYLAEQKKNAQQQVDPNQQQLAQLLQLIVQLKAESEMNKAQIASLTAQLAKQSNVVQPASQSASQSTTAVTGGATNV